jgi:hypothetical protein
LQAEYFGNGFSLDRISSIRPPPTTSRIHLNQPQRRTSAEIAEEMIIPVEIISNLMFLIGNDCADPTQVQSYLRMTDEPLRRLREIITRERRSALGE